MNTPLMHLQRLRVTQLRKFEALELNGFTPGLNILAGPNGAGKSSLHRALRAAFLDRYSSNASAADLQPAGNTGAAPTVELEFSVQGTVHRLVKTFLKKKRCDLQVGSHSYSEEAAEDYLAQTLGFGFAARGSKPDTWGIPGLLWVEQGADHMRFTQSVGFAAAHLNKALHAQSSASSTDISTLAATAGDTLIAQLETQLAQFIGKSGKPIGAYAQLLERIEALEADVRAHQQRIAQYRSQVDELDSLQQQAQQDSQQQLLVQWQQALQQAQARLAQAEQAQAAHTQAIEKLQHLDTQLQVTAQVLQQQQQRSQEVQRRAQQITLAEQALAQAQAQHAQATQRLQASQMQHAQALQAVQQAEQARLRVQLQQQLQAQRTRTQQLHHAVQQAHQALQQLTQLNQQLPTQRIEKTDVAQLRKLEEAVLRARLQHEAAATQLQFELPAGQHVTWRCAAAQGQWQGTGQQWLTSATHLELSGGARLTITPGGKDVAAAALHLQQSEQALIQALQRLQVDHVAQAQALLEQRQDIQAQQQLAQQLLQAHAPQGLDALELEHTQAQQQTQLLQQQCDGLPCDQAPAVDWQQAQAALRTAQAHCDDARSQEQVARQHLALAQQTLHSAQQEHAAVQQHLQDPALLHRWQQAEQEAALLQTQRKTYEAHVAQTAHALQSADLCFAQQDMERLQRSIAAHEQQVHQREVRMASLRAALEQSGAQGLEEVCAQAQAELSHAQRTAHDISQRCAALDTVLTRLKAKRMAALRRLQAPLETRLQHYLQLLLPGGKIELDEQLVPHVVLSASEDAAARRVAGHVEQLSYGTQEQLAIISRLAYADVLRDSGQPTLLILDDALVHSDAHRLAQMKRVLFDAATRHQIVLLTCKPHDWLDAGGHVQYLPAD